MLPTKGLFTDSSLIDQPDKTHRDARNIVFTKLYGAILNEPGFEITAIGYPTSQVKPIGVAIFPDNSYVLLSDGINGGLDRIGYVDVNDNYTDLIVDNILGFDYNFPIRSAEIDYNYLNQRIIAWTDYNQKPRILNIDALPFDLNPDKSLVDPATIIELEMFPTFLDPSITLVSTSQNGAVPAGNYSFFLAYEDNDGTRTPYSPPLLNINITDGDPSSTIKLDGSVPGTITAKSITLNISNIDRRYDKLVLVAIAKKNNITTAFEIKKYNTSQATFSGNYQMNVTYVGNELTTAITLEEAIAVFPLYTKSKALAQLNNVLYQGFMEAQVDADLQAMANNIRIFYNTKLVDITDVNNSQKNNAPVGFAHGGTYAFYIRGKYTNGSYTRAFVIPGRNNYVGENPRATSSLAAGEGLTAMKYQVEDTTNQGGHLYGSPDSKGVIHTTSMAVNTNMGFWENQSEQYPTNFAGIAGQNVRHHVFPTIRQCRNTHYSGVPLYGASKMDILGIDVTNVVIPGNLQGQIIGWQIMYAKRDYVNSTTYGTDTLLYAANLDDDANRIWSAGGNWWLDARNSSGATSDGHLYMRNDYLRGHSIELLKDKPQLGSTNLYIDLEFKLRRDLLYNGYAGNAAISGNLVQSGNNVGQNPGVLIDYTITSNITITFPGSQIIKSVSGFRYLPTGIIDGNIQTVKNEEAIHLQINNPTFSNPITRAKVNLGTPSRDGTYPMNNASDSGFEETYLITYKQIKSNLYNNYDQQLLIATDTVITNSATTFCQNIYGGDTFIGLRSFITTAPFRETDLSGVGGLTIIRAHLAESRFNIGLRYEIAGDVTTKYYPKTSPYNFWTNPTQPNQDGVTVIFDITSNANTFGYSNDYNAINDLTQPIIANPTQILVNTFPNRVIRSGFAGTNAQSLRSWKTYLIGDNYEANRNKGPIENLAVLDDVLLIHHFHALFRTTGKDKMLLSTTEVFLGTNDIFSQQPKDMVPSKLGNLGTQNIYSCFTFKGGYFWTDQQSGKVYLMTSQSVDELSDNGMRIFFYENFKIDNTLPNNPLIGNGITAGFDKINNRIILVKRGTNPFTISYSLDYKSWACFHDYAPDYMFFTNENLFCFGNNKIYKCDSDTKKGLYLDGTIYPSYIDLVFNDDNGKDKLFIGASWISEVYNQSNVIQPNLTLTSIEGKTSRQDSGEINLTPFSSFGQFYNTRSIINKWNFNMFRDNNSQYRMSRPLRDKYSVVRFKYNNQPNLDSTQNSLYLYDFEIKSRKAEL